MTRTLAAAIATSCEALKNCKANGNTWGQDHHEKALKHYTDLLPSGSGFDSGTTILPGLTTDSELWLKTAFHHMNENGYYTEWTYHTITVTPRFSGIDIYITGSNLNDIKDYINEVFYTTLTKEAPIWTPTPST